MQLKIQAVNFVSTYEFIVYAKNQVNQTSISIRLKSICLKRMDGETLSLFVTREWKVKL